MIHDPLEYDPGHMILPGGETTPWDRIAERDTPTGIVLLHY